MMYNIHFIIFNKVLWLFVGGISENAIYSLTKQEYPTYRYEKMFGYFRYISTYLPGYLC